MGLSTLTTRLQNKMHCLRLVIAAFVFSAITSAAVADFHTSDEPEPEFTYGFEAYAETETQFSLFDRDLDKWFNELVTDVAEAVGRGETPVIAPAVADVIDPRGSATVNATAIGQFAYQNDGGTKLQLKLVSQGRASASFSEPTASESAYGFAAVKYFDRTTFSGDGILPVIGDPNDPTKLLLNFKVDGSVTLRGLNYSSVGLSLVGQSGDFTATALYEWSRDSSSSSPDFSTRVESAGFTLTGILGPDQNMDWDISAFLGGFSSGGRFQANFGNTITLDSITFEDGSTPEERGFTLRFDSGLTSPNLLSRDPEVTPVPEPSTLGLLGLGSLGLCATRRRRRLLNATRHRFLAFRMP